MPKTITTYEAKNFSTRKDLEKKVSELVELTPTQKQDFEITGTLEELARLGLSPRTIFYGIRCKGTDYVEKIGKNQPKPERGEIKEYKLN